MTGLKCVMSQRGIQLTLVFGLESPSASGRPLALYWVRKKSRFGK